MANDDVPDVNLPASFSTPPPPPVQRQTSGSLIGLWIALACMGVIMFAFVAVAVIGLLAAIAIPAFMKGRDSARRGVCVNNLRQIDAAKQIYAVENGATNGTVLTWDNLAPYIEDMSNKTFCSAAVSPAIRTPSACYTIEPVGEDPKCTVSPYSHTMPGSNLQPTRRRSW